MAMELAAINSLDVGKCFWCNLTIFRINFFKNIFQERYQSAKLYPDQDQCSVGPRLGPNCLQRLSAEDKSCH